jgi:sugar lactone lactonase YvrE
MSFNAYYTTTLNTPIGTVFDSSGNLYVANSNAATPAHGSISKITTDGVVSQYSSAFINSPQYLAFDTSGNLYCSSVNNIIKIISDGSFTIYNTSPLTTPRGIAFVGTTLYVANNSGNTISKIDTSGTVTTFTTSGITFSTPQGLIYDGTANLYVVNNGANAVFKIVVATGVATEIGSTILGTNADGRGIARDSSGNLYVSRSKNSSTVADIAKITTGSVLSIYTPLYMTPCGLSFDNSGNLFVANQAGNNIYKITSSPVGTFLASTLFIGGLSSSVATGSSLVFDTSGNLYASNNIANSNTISKITPSGVISTFAVGIQTSTTTNLLSPQGLTFDSSGNLYCISGISTTAVINKITSSGVVSLFSSIGTGGVSNPKELILNSAGTYFYTSNQSGTISQINGPLSTGTVSAVSFASGLSTPKGLAFDSSGNLYVGTGGNVTKIVIVSDAFVSKANYNGSTLFSGVFGVAFDSFGDLYVSSSTQDSISKITPSGTVTTPYGGLNVNPEYIAFDKSGVTPTNLIYYSGSDNSIYVSASPSCFNYDTKILCIKNNEEIYIPIQDLRNEDVVKTYLHGNRKIKLIGKRKMINSHNILRGMYIWKKSDKNNLTEDLIITGGHSILVNKLTKEEIINQERFRQISTIDDKFLLLSCNDNDFTRIEDENEYTYYHLVLENDDINSNFGIWVNGILSETICEAFFLKHHFELL